MSATKLRVASPLALLQLKQKVGREKADELALPIMIYLDAAQRGHGFLAAENALVKLVVITQCIGSKSNNRAFYDLSCDAGDKLLKACRRGTELLAFTTAEYKAVKAMVRAYLKVLPTLSVAMLVFASMEAEKLIANNLVEGEA